MRSLVPRSYIQTRDEPLVGVDDAAFGHCDDSVVDVSKVGVAVVVAPLSEARRMGRRHRRGQLPPFVADSPRRARDNMTSFEPSAGTSGPGCDRVGLTPNKFS